MRNMATGDSPSFDNKFIAQSTDIEVADYGASHLGEEKRGTTDDQRDMFRMGKTQEMKRNFRFVSIFGFSMILMCTWEVVLGTSFFSTLR